MEPPEDNRLQGAAERLGATPLELIGLAVLLTGALVASWALWWSATGRPNELPSTAVDVGIRDGTAAVLPGAGPVEPGPPSSGDGKATHDHAGNDHAENDHAGNDHAAGPGAGDDGVGVATELTVHVTGAVAAPGLVVVAGGARVGEAVQAAGGLSGDADPELVNLARVLQDGEHVHIPRQGDEPVRDVAPSGDVVPGDPGGPTTTDGRIDLNRASAEELQALPGIGPARADAIVAFREENGPFAVPGDLRAVSGIGEATFQRLADLVTAG